jgi:hypothetical protein
LLLVVAFLHCALVAHCCLLAVFCLCSLASPCVLVPCHILLAMLCCCSLVSLGCVLLVLFNSSLLCSIGACQCLFKLCFVVVCRHLFVMLC